jgi:ABC-type uncharacterized transport system substrate-binding protein
MTRGRRRLVLAAASLLVALAARAQAPERMRVIGVLGNAGTAASDAFRIFVAALANLGWVEGKTASFVVRGAEQGYERFPALAAELVALRVDLLVVTAGVTAALAAKQATTTIPILAVGVADPVKFGLVASMARPGGNVTGFATTATDWGKYLDLARTAVAGATRIAVIGNPTNVGYADYVAANETAARGLGLQLQMIPVAHADDLHAAFDAMKRERSEALVFGPDRVFLSHMAEILERAHALAIPVIGPVPPAAELGALLSYGPDAREIFRQAASYADRLLRGAKPADLPIEQPSRYVLVVNLRTAKALGIRIPTSLRLQADVVIE